MFPAKRGILAGRVEQDAYTDMTCVPDTPIGSDRPPRVVVAFLGHPVDSVARRIGLVT